jgi:hypothetical protein
MADSIASSHIHFIWIEIPHPIEPGPREVRLFFAQTDPPEPVIPNPNYLKCSLSSQDEFAVLVPERVLFEFMPDGTFTGSFTYEACPECVECYMNWNYTLEMTGIISRERLSFDISVSHFGHNVQGSYLSTELNLVKDAFLEPRIECKQAGECGDIQMVSLE